MQSDSAGGVERFKRDKRGAATVEFVIALPVLLAVLVFSTQYGRAMQVRNALDVAVRDAARFLSRAPLAGDSVPAAFVTEAESLITSRMGEAVESVNFVEVSGSTAQAEVTVVANVRLPLLRLIRQIAGGEGDLSSIPMHASEVWPRTETDL
ncbi:MAG: TadE/TadG family type IV pilus assembly protein [Pseudomonadota bacterium]